MFQGVDNMSNNELLLAISEMMDSKLKPLKLTLENDILPRLQNIESCYTSTYDRYRNTVEDYESMRQDISILKSVVMEHSEKLQNIS